MESLHDHVVLWDFDGTLARRKNLWAGALLDAWRAVDPSTTATVEQLRPHLGRGFPWHEAERVRPPQTPAEWWSAMTPVFVAAYRANRLDDARARAAALAVPGQFYLPDDWVLIDGAIEALRTTIRAGYRNIILSNHGPELPALVDALQLGRLVERTITSAAVGAEKPNPAIFEFAVKTAGVRTLDHVWMVGDNPVADGAGAAAFGIRSILADGVYPNARGVCVLEAARQIAEA